MSELNPVQQEYAFQVCHNELKKILNNAKTLDNKKHKTISGNYLAPFIEQLKKIDNNASDIQNRNCAYHGDTTTRKNQVFLRINADCKKCPNNSKVRYVITIEEKPKETDVFVGAKVIIKNQHDHNNNNQSTKKQVRGDTRTEVAEKIRAAGGAAAFITKQIADGKETVTATTARKIVSTEKNKEFSTDWLYSLHATADAFEAAGNPFIQQLITHKEFAMYLYDKLMMKCIHNIPAQNRILHLDATGNLTKIPKNKRIYSRILNYILLLKDSRQISDMCTGKTTKSAIVGDMCSSRHDVYRLSDFFRCFKTDYAHEYSEDLIFRLVIQDYNFMQMHSSTESFNNEDLISYSNKVWRLSQYDDTIDINKTTWICSCASHTMKRFINRLKKIIFDKMIIRFAAYCFSLLLNCIDLHSISTYFEILCFIFYSKFKNQEVQDHLIALEEAFRERPIGKIEIIKIISAFKLISNEKSPINTTIQSSKPSRPKKNDTIKAQSPFTKHFLDIATRVQLLINNNIENSQENQYYAPQYIKFLLESFMPYAFLWSGFVLRNLNNDNIRTRFTNGAIENYFASRKQMGQYYLKLLPAQYASHALKMTTGKNKQFLQQSDIDTDESDNDSSEDEEDRLYAQERWCKKQNLIMPKKNTIGFFQKAVNLDLASNTTTSIIKKYKKIKATRSKLTSKFLFK